MHGRRTWGGGDALRERGQAKVSLYPFFAVEMAAQARVLWQRS
jgi:hypothetical protein